MSHWRNLQGFVICLLSMSATSYAHAANIYLAVDVNGAEHYSDVALDSSYVLFLKEERPRDNPTTSQHQPSEKQRFTHSQFDGLINQYAIQYSVDPILVQAVISTESSFRPEAVSSAGARGLMQLMPATAKQYGVNNPSDPAQNIEAGIHYLKDLLTLHQGNVALALASYHAGQSTVEKYRKRIPPFPETMLYVATVLAKYQSATGAPPHP